MQKRILIIVICLPFWVSNVAAQIPETIRKDLGNGKAFIQIVNNQKIAEQGYTLHNVKEGMWTLFWETNIPREATSYSAGKRNGTSLQFTRDGFCEVAENYSNDTLDGARRTFGRQMNMLEETYYTAGKRNGVCRKWFASGTIQEESNFANGLREGKTTWYYEKSQIAIAYNYKGGILEGTSISYWENGKPNEVGEYEKGEQTGAWKEYYENGDLKAEGFYIKGKKHGKWTEYDTNTKKSKTVKY